MWEWLCKAMQSCLSYSCLSHNERCYACSGALPRTCNGRVQARKHTHARTHTNTRMHAHKHTKYEYRERKRERESYSHLEPNQNTIKTLWRNARRRSPRKDDKWLRALGKERKGKGEKGKKEEKKTLSGNRSKRDEILNVI